jgi:transposase
MASLTEKRVRGIPYYYLRECKRVNGKPKIVWQHYIGTRAALVQRLMEPGAKPDTVAVREFGASAACLKIAQELDLVGIIDRIVPKAKRSNSGPSVGEYILIAAINRCVAPRSKAMIGEWYDQTVLPRLLSAQSSQLTSRLYWAQMNRIDEQAVARIAAEVAKTAVKRFKLDLRSLLFDATNFFTFVDSFNTRPKLLQRGHSKEGRANLRILGLALLVTADGEVPLLHHTYAGNQHDATTFGQVIGDIAKNVNEMHGLRDITLVFDKGNNSKENLAETAKESLHFVGSLVPTQHQELLRIPRTEMRRLDKAQLPAVWAHRLQQKVYGTERTVLVVFNRPLYTSQVKTLNRETAKRRRKLKELHVALQKAAQRDDGKKKPTLEGTRKKVAAILKGRHMKDLFSVNVTTGGEDDVTASGGNKDAKVRMSWRFNNNAYKELKQTLLGKTILFTDQADWTDEQIVRAYRAQAHVEFAFRGMKNPRYLAFRPQFHWTDSKLRVHTLICVIALTIATLMRRQLGQAGVPNLSLVRMFDRLEKVRECTLLYLDPKTRSLRTQTVLSEQDETQGKMLAALELAEFRAR